MAGGIWVGLMRRRESAHVLRRHRRSGRWEDEALADSEPAPPQQSEEMAAQRAFNRVESLHDELLALEQRKRQHLAIPPSRTEHRMRLSTVFIVILLMLLAGLFFFGGYLFHVMNTSPMATQPLSAAAQSSWQQTRTDALPQQDTVEERVTDGASYLQRRAVIRESQPVTSDPYARTISRGRQAAQQEAQTVLSNTVQTISNSVRSVVGSHLGNIFAPIAQELVQGTVGRAIQQKPSNARSQVPAPAGMGAVGQPSTSQGALAGPAVVPSTPAPQTQASGPQYMAPGTPAQATVDSDATAPQPATAGPATQSQVSEPLPAASFAIDVGSFVEHGDAYSLLQNLQGRGYNNTYIIKILNGSTMTFHVRVGNFQSYGDAVQARVLLNMPARIVLAPSSGS